MKTKLILSLLISGIAASSHAAPFAVKVWGTTSAVLTSVPSLVTNACEISWDYGGCIALRTDGSVVAWGPAWGPGMIVPGCESNIVSIAPGAAVRANGTVVDFGANVPPGLTNIAATSPGAVLMRNGTVRSWMSFEYFGGTAPLMPPGLSNITSIASFEQSGCALTASGRAIFGGGLSAFGNPLQPYVAPADWTNITSVGVTSSRILGLRSDGTVTLAIGSPFVVHRMPAGLETVVAVSAGGYTDLALLADGPVLTWLNGVPRDSSLLFEAGVLRAVPPMSKVVRICQSPGFSMALMDLNHAPGPSVIFRQPASQTVPQHGTVSFRVVASAVVAEFPLSYQWFFENSPIPQATNSILTLTDLHAANAGNYHVLITSGDQSTNSVTAHLSVVPVVGVQMVTAVYMNGDVGTRYRLECINSIGSTDVWLTLTNVILPSDPYIFFDLSAIGQPKRVYRQVQIQ